MDSQEILSTIGKRLKERREGLQMTQAQLSYACNTDPSYIRKVESGKVNISLIKLKELVTALDTTLSEFLQDV